MDLQRGLLLGGLVITGYLLWMAWQDDYVQVVQVPAVAQHGDVTHIAGAQDVPAQQATHDSTTPANQIAIPTEKPSSSQKLVRVTTDVLDVWIDLHGGNIVQADLLQYKAKEGEDAPVRLLQEDPSKLYVAQSGLTSASGPDQADKGQADYKVTQTQYVLTEGQDTVSVPLTWKNNQGLSVIKLFTFTRSDYLVNVAFDIHNKTSKPWTGQFYGQFKVAQIFDNFGFFGFQTYRGGAISSPDKRFEKTRYDDLSEQPLNRYISDGWLAMLQHYFVSAWIPTDKTGSYHYISTIPENNVYRMTMISPIIEVLPGQTQITEANLYMGPKISDDLKASAPGLDLTIDYGWFWPISAALFWLMKKCYLIFGNWGWSIILVTILIKLAFYQLSAKSYRSMAELRQLQPKIVELREKHGDDKQKMSQELMALYKKEKINPLGGCLPILVQIPVFIALFWVLVESVEFRLAPFALWITDLSVKDPYYVLPIIMGISMLIQQKLSPPPPDPMQAKVLMLMPIVFTVLFLNFPAGLVLYWVVNNTISILQQWMITRRIEQAAAGK